MNHLNAALFDEDVFRLFGIRPSQKTPYSDITHANGKPRKKVKRPMNSFMAFSFFERKKICSENPKIHNAEVSRKLGDLWKHTGADQKRLFEKIAKMLKIYHEIEFPDYKYKPKKKPKQPAATTAAVPTTNGAKKPARRKATKKFVSGKENLVSRPSSVSSGDINDSECSSNPGENESSSYMDVVVASKMAEQKIVLPESVLTPPSSAPMTPESVVDSALIFPSADNFSEALASAAAGISSENSAVSASSHFFDILPLGGGISNFMDQYESENSSSSLTFSSSPAEFQPLFTENQLMQFDPLTDEDLLQ